MRVNYVIDHSTFFPIIYIHWLSREDYKRSFSPILMKYTTTHHELKKYQSFIFISPVGVLPFKQAFVLLSYGFLKEEKKEQKR